VPQSTLLDEAQLSLDGDLREIETLAVWLRRFSQSHELDEDADLRLNLVLEELFTNAVRHGGCQGMAAAASIRLRIEGRELLVEYADRGQPFDPADAPTPDLGAPLEQRSAGGLGVHFVKQMARRIEYHRVDGWNRITLRLAI
jgi:serine/threonine-protein kinase RsbW